MASPSNFFGNSTNSSGAVIIPRRASRPTRASGHSQSTDDGSWSASFDSRTARGPSPFGTHAAAVFEVPKSIANVQPVMDGPLARPLWR